MKKYIQITTVLGLFSLLVLYRHMKGNDESPVIIPPTQRVPTTMPTVANTTSLLSQSPTPTAGSAALYKNGTYVGSTEDAYYGNIQVQATISEGRITNIVFLQYPNDNSTSLSISQQAMPYLKQEAISAQSSHIDVVTGASDTSAAFQKSLQNALDQAHV